MFNGKNWQHQLKMVYIFNQNSEGVVAFQMIISLSFYKNVADKG
jgi:hypothetical protein